MLMAGYQFIHVESYARSAGAGKAGGHSIASVMAEATRVDDACPHVENPQPPTLLFGVQPSEVEAAANDWADATKDAQGRKLRKDGLCLLAGVVSCPPEFTDEQWAAFKLDAVAFLAGDGRLLSCIEHMDEKERHFHFYKLAKKGERFKSIHPGKMAAAEAKARGELKGGQNAAYKAAMRGYQNAFFESVASKHGMARIGPKKRRLTRDAWKAEKAMLAAVAEKQKTLANMQGDLEAKLAAVAVEKEAIKSHMAEVLAKADAAASIDAANKAIIAEIKAKSDAVEKALKASKISAEKNRTTVAYIRGEKAKIEAAKKADIRRKNIVGVVGELVGTFGRAAILPIVAALDFVKAKKAKDQIKKLAQESTQLNDQLRAKNEEFAALESEKKRAIMALDVAKDKHRKELLAADQKTAALEAKIKALTGPELGQPLRPLAPK